MTHSADCQCRWHKGRQNSTTMRGYSLGVTFKISPPRTLPIRPEYNTGPTPRDAILDLVNLIRESTPEEQDYIYERLNK